MNLLQLQKATKSFGLKTLFQEASFSVNQGEHIGVIGPNGAGKTTLFKILAGQDSLDSGLLTTSKNIRIGYLEQEADWDVSQKVEGYLEANSSLPIWELKKIAISLGLTQEQLQSNIADLSGGYRMRVKLLAIIGKEPNLMLLDEPTNFLDLESILALESFLQSYNGSFLLISHDREFLRRTTESTLEVEQGDITKFPGNIDDYFEQKSQLRQIQETQAANLENKRKHIQKFIDRFKAKATKARQAQSRMKLLEKMEKIELKALPTRAKIFVPPPTHTGKNILMAEELVLGYGSKRVLSEVNISLVKGTHLGVVGFNGAGKSTLLKSLANEIPLIEGNIDYGHNVSFSYFSQHSRDQLQMNDSVLQSLEKAAHPNVNQQEILAMAGSLLFTDSDVHKEVRILSGGEKARVALGQVLLRKCPLLLLDEPTNHLDFDTVETLTEALKTYEGTIVVVSHDRSFIGRVASQILEIKDSKVSVYPGTYDDYLWSLQKGSLSQRANSSSETDLNKTTPETLVKTNSKQKIKQIKQSIIDEKACLRKLESQLEKLTEEQVNLNEELLVLSGEAAAKAAKKLRSCSIAISKLEEEVLNSMENLEKLSHLLEV